MCKGIDKIVRDRKVAGKMTQEVIINDVTIHVEHFDNEMVTDKATGEKWHKIDLEFKVSSKDYHEITTLLYANNFDVEVPGKGLSFQATIQSYSTSITNLYEEGA